MLEAIQSIFGVYTPITYVADGVSVIPAGLSGVNMEYVLEGVLFAICLMSVFKIIGVILKKI